MITIYDAAALKAAVNNTNRRVSFLIGAPLSLHQGRGVPGVAGVIEIIRSEVKQRDANALRDLDAVLGSDPAAAYQKAFAFLAGRFDGDVVDGVIRSAVLQARRPEAPAFADPETGEGDPADWTIPPGLRDLADLIKSDPTKFAGPILTTNFDPLLFLALSQVGLTPRGIPLTQDGAYEGGVKDSPDAVDIVHLHGYWRRPGTMHTPDQLTSARPRLLTSLRRLLEDRLLLVVGFGGWNDVITEAIAGCLSDPSFKGQVRWSFRNGDAAQVREQNAALLRRFEPGVTANGILFHGGVDGHSIFRDLREGDDLAIAEGDARMASPIPGWEMIDAQFLSRQPALESAGAVKFFDGGAPAWRHAVSPLVPRLSHAGRLLQVLEEGVSGAGRGRGPHLQLIRSAGGEGKTTLLLQMAASLAAMPNIRVLWRPERQLGTTAEAIARLAAKHHWVIVADQAESLIDPVWTAAMRLHAEGRSNVTFLLAARDTDWLAAGGDARPWATHLDRLPDIKLSGLSLEDARAISDAWGEHGREELRGLAEIPPGERARHLAKAAQPSKGPAKSGSFLGALMDVRFDDQALRAHVRDVMVSLDAQPLRGGEGSLLQALLPIAAAQSAGFEGLHLRIVKTLTNTPESWVSTTVVKPLGAELGVGWGGDLVETRHKRVADAIVVESETLGFSLEDVWRNIIAATAKVGRNDQGRLPQHSALLFSSQKLISSLPISLSSQRREQIVVAAARAAVEFQPEWLGCVVNLGTVLQELGRFDEAVSVFHEHAPKAHEAVGYTKVIRGFLNEWGVSEGLRKKPSSSAANAWLCCASLSDQYPGGLDRLRVRKSTSGLCVAFGVLADGKDGVFSRARRAAERLARRTLPDRRIAAFLDGDKQELDAIGVPSPQSLQQTLAWLAEGAAEALRLADRARLPTPAGGFDLTFTSLNAEFARRGWLRT